MRDSETNKPQCVACGDILSIDAEEGPLPYYKTGAELDGSNRPHPLVKALYKLVLCIAKGKNSFTITEELIMPCMKGVCFELLGESASS
jgi:hypothetical protein